MGSHVSDWSQAVGENAGAIYIGADNTAIGVLWLIVSVGLCVFACISGSKHELESYKRLSDSK